MKTITEQLVTGSQGLLTLSGEVSDSTNRFAMFNDAGVETEVGEFLFGMVRVTKPHLILETGTHVGVGASYLGSALRANGFGHLDTYEHDFTHWNNALRLLYTLDLGTYVSARRADVRQLVLEDAYDMIFLDTEPDMRFDELLRFWPNLTPGGYLFIHDLHRDMGQTQWEGHEFAWPWGVMPDRITDLVKSGELVPFHFPTPRGLFGCYKPTSNDYQWGNS